MTTAQDDQTPDAPQFKRVVKVYLVMLRRNLAPAGRPNVEILNAFLTRKQADEVVAAMPGTYVQRVNATK